MKVFLSFILIIICSSTLTAQSYTKKWNKSFDRYEHFDSQGNMIGYEKYNNLFNRWEYFESDQPSTYKQSEVYEPYNIEEIYKLGIAKQKAYDYNLGIVYDKLNLLKSSLSEVIKQNGGLTKEQIELRKTFNKDFHKAINSDLSNTNNVRNILNWMDNWERAINSWSNY